MNPIEDKLKSQLKNDTMRVPDGYFEHLEQDIFNNLANEQLVEKKLDKKSPIVKRLFMLTAVAATITIAFFGINWLVKSNAHNIGVEFAKMSDAELDTYMNEQIASLSIDDLYGYLNQNVSQLNTAVLFNAAFENTHQIDESITGDLHEQVLDADVLNAVVESEPSINDKKLLDAIDDELLQEYLNDATLFENLGL
jgi:uncharacterized HAD superfamily protein